MAASVTVTAASPAVVTHTAHPHPTGSGVRFDYTSGGSLPAGISAATTYFTRWASANTYQLSSSNAAAQITADATTDAIYWPGHPFSANDALFFGTNGTIPGGLTASNNAVAVPTYFYAKTIVDADHFTVSATAGGAQIDITSAGSGTHFATKHVPVNTTTTGANVTAMGYDAGYAVHETAALDWVTGANYVVSQMVNTGFLSYRCLVAHTAGTFATDLAAGKWELAVSVVLGGQEVKIDNVPLAVPVVIANLVVGSRVRVSLDSDGSMLSLGNADSSTYSFSIKASGLVNVDVRNSSGTPKYLPYKAQGIIGADGMSMFVSQVLDTVA